MWQLDRKVTYKYEYQVARRTHIIATHSDSAVIPLSTYDTASGTKCSDSFGRWCVAKGSLLDSAQQQYPRQTVAKKEKFKNYERKTWPKANCSCNEYTFRMVLVVSLQVLQEVALIASHQMNIFCKSFAKIQCDSFETTKKAADVTLVSFSRRNQKASNCFGHSSWYMVTNLILSHFKENSCDTISQYTQYAIIIVYLCKS